VTETEERGVQIYSFMFNAEQTQESLIMQSLSEDFRDQRAAAV
jgi:hypothetical protein